MNLPVILALAEKHRNANSSALSCFDAAEKAVARKAMTFARFQALKSLAHSVGILHADYKTAWEAAGFTGPIQLPVCYDLACVTVHLADGTSYKTNVNAGVFDLELKHYFVGKAFNVGRFPEEKFVKCIRIEIDRTGC